MNKGSINKEKFVEIVKNDLGIKTNPYFDKSMRKVDFTYGEVIKGIDKVCREENHNLKPNTCDPTITSGYD